MLERRSPSELREIVDDIFISFSLAENYFAKVIRMAHRSRIYPRTSLYRGPSRARIIESTISHSISGRCDRLMNAFHRASTASEFAKDGESTIGSAGVGVPLF